MGTNQILSETEAENKGAKTLLEIWNTRKQIFYDGGTGEQANHFRGTREHAGTPIPIHEIASGFRPVQEIWYLDK